MVSHAGTPRLPLRIVQVRNCFQQRSRWSKGHFQVFFSGHNPIFARGLSPLMRWMYGSVILSYFSAFTSTPLLMLVPMITVRPTASCVLASCAMSCSDTARCAFCARCCLLPTAG